MRPSRCVLNPTFVSWESLFYENLGLFSQGSHPFGVDGHENDGDPNTHRRPFHQLVRKPVLFTLCGAVGIRPHTKIRCRSAKTTYAQCVSGVETAKIVGGGPGVCNEPPLPFLSSPRSASFRPVHGALLRFVKLVSAAYVGVQSTHTLWYDCPARGSHVGGLHCKQGFTYRSTRKGEVPHHLPLSSFTFFRSPPLSFSYKPASTTSNIV